jgi:AcrR family transcriptional regulator
MAEVCAERGYGETTVAAVIERAGLPRETFEENFANKEECGVAAITEILAELMASSSAAWSADVAEWESVVRTERALLELMASRPSFAQMVYIEARQTMPHRAFERYWSSSQVKAAMLDRLRAYTPGAVRQPPSAARAAVGGAEALIRREIVSGRIERLPELLPDITYGVLVPFLGQEDALRYTRLARELLDNSRRERGVSG